MKLKCTNCGGEVPISEESEFVQCGFCGVDLYVEMDQTVRHLYLDFEIEEKDCHGYLKKRLSERELSETFSVVRVEKKFFTYWCFENKELKSSMVCAEPVPLREMNIKDIPPGKPKVLSKERVREKGKGENKAARKKLEQALAEYCRESGMEPPDGVLTKLLETPCYLVEYNYQGNTYEAVVDGTTGTIHGDEWPPGTEGKKNRLLGGIALLTGGVFLLESIFVPSYAATLLAYGVTTAVAYHYIIRTLGKMGW